MLNDFIRNIKKIHVINLLNFEYKNIYIIKKLDCSNNSRIYYDNVKIIINIQFKFNDNYLYIREIFNNITDYLRNRNRILKKIFRLIRIEKRKCEKKILNKYCHNLLISQETCADIIHEIGHAFEKDASNGTYKLNDRISNYPISIVDYGNIKKCTYVPFDDEGVSSKKSYVIKEGLVHEMLTSKELVENKECLTGNYRISSCEDAGFVRMTNTYMESKYIIFNKSPFKNFTGIYIESVKQAYYKNKTIYINPEFCSYYVNGVRKDIIPIYLIKQNIENLLNNIDGVYGKIKFFNGVCIKNSQIIDVGKGGCYIKFKN